MAYTKPQIVAQDTHGVFAAGCPEHSNGSTCSCMLPKGSWCVACLLLPLQGEQTLFQVA